MDKTDEDTLAELFKIAQNADKGAWTSSGTPGQGNCAIGLKGKRIVCAKITNKDELKFLATFDPPTVLSLISELRELKNESTVTILLKKVKKLKRRLKHLRS